MTWTARTRTSHNTLRLCLALTWVCSASTAQVQMILGQIVFYMSPSITPKDYAQGLRPGCLASY